MGTTIKNKDEEIKIDPTANTDQVATGYKYDEWNGGTGVAGQTEDLAQKVINMNYDDFTKGNDYQSLVKRYSQNGRRAMDDTLGMAAARTGGLASSYAVAAGNQAYNDHMSKLEDAARALYDSQRAEAKDNYNIAQGMYDRQYGEWQDERNFGYGVYRDTVGDAQWKDEQITSQSNEDREWDYTIATDEQADARNQMLMQFSEGTFPTTEEEIAALAEATGWDAATIAAYQAYYEDLASDEAAADATEESLEADSVLMDLLGSGMTWEEINSNDKYDEYVENSTFGEDYWSNIEGMITEENQPINQSEPIETTWSKSEVDETVAERDALITTARDDISKGSSPRTPIPYPTARVNAEYYAQYGENIPGYFGEEYKDHYNQIQNLTGDRGELEEYLNRFYDPDDTSTLDVLCEIVEFFGIDPTPLTISMPSNDNTVSGNTVSGNTGIGGPVKVPGGFIALPGA